nr:hypothetical protein [Tanacetum cinerariifolium]
MGELTFFLGLQVKQKKDGIFISQDKYVAEILKKFRFTKVKTASTPKETQKPLLKDEDSKEVDVYMNRSMIGSLMYLTSSRPDIMFVVCAYARYQVNSMVSHLHTVKRIFKYLKGQLKLGLWYPKDSLFDLVAYTDSDYAGTSLDRKSTTGVLLVILSTAELLQLDTLNTVRKPTRKVTQVPQPSDPIEHVAVKAVHKKSGDGLVRAATTACSLGAGQDSGNTLQSDKDRMKLNKLMALCTTLQNRVLELEKIKTSQHNEIASLKRRVKKLKKRNRSRTHKLKKLYKVGLTARVESSDDEKSFGEDASKQGRIEAIDENKDIAQVSDQDDAKMFDVNVLGGEEVFAAVGKIENVVNITTEELTLAQALEALKTLKPKSQDKGKAIMIEEPVKPKKKDQIRLSEEATKRLQAVFDEEEILARERERELKKIKKPHCLD